MKWETYRKDYLFTSRWLTVRKNIVKLPSGIQLDDYYVLGYLNWVVIIVCTKTGQYLVEKQYRHGIDSVCFEICAGIVELNEEPIEAVK